MAAEETRGDYTRFMPIQTRWSDNDLYGHVNNVTYYSYFDTAVNAYYIEAAGMDILNAEVIGVVVETKCNFRSSVAYPEALVAGLRVAHLGRTSVRWEIGIFGPDQETAAAFGHFVHVFVDRASNTPVPIPPRIRAALERLVPVRRAAS
ncbi:MAG: acyl-CoA thioesterase [Rhodobacterales bacterium]|nr:acyl-CoA thioesterase [Rhodobacterales bacterium]